MAKIMDVGDTESRTFRARHKFAITMYADTGAIEGDWYLHHSPDGGEHWMISHAEPFSEADPSETFEIPAGWQCKVMGGTGTNVVVYADYLMPEVLNISNHILPEDDTGGSS